MRTALSFLHFRTESCLEGDKQLSGIWRLSRSRSVPVLCTASSSVTAPDGHEIKGKEQAGVDKSGVSLPSGVETVRKKLEEDKTVL